MTPERLEELLWQRHDGCISVEDLAELEEHLRNHPQARELEATVSELARHLQSKPTVAVPEELRRHIDRSLAELEPHPQSPPILASAAVRRHPPQLRRWPLPLAAGLILGATIVQLLHMGYDRVPEPALFSGSMRLDTRPVHPDQLMVDIDEHGGQLRVRRTAGEVEVEISLVAPRTIDLLAEQPAGGVRVMLLETFSGHGPRLSSDGTRCVLRARGPVRIKLLLATTDISRPLHLEISADGAVVVDRWLAGRVPEDGR